MSSFVIFLTIFRCPSLLTSSPFLSYSLSYGSLVYFRDHISCLSVPNQSVLCCPPTRPLPSSTLTDPPPPGVMRHVPCLPVRRPSPVTPGVPFFGLSTTQDQTAPPFSLNPEVVKDSGVFLFVFVLCPKTLPNVLLQSLSFTG